MTKIISTTQSNSIRYRVADISGTAHLWFIKVAARVFMCHFPSTLLANLFTSKFLTAPEANYRLSWPVATIISPKIA